MTFKEIIENWRALPRNPVTGRLFNDSAAMREFKRDLTAPDRRGWFNACHDWHAGGPSPEGHEEMDAILDCLPAFQQEMARAHLDCARLARRPGNSFSGCDVKAVAERWDLLESFVLELANEIRSGEPRRPLALPVHSTCPLVWEGRGTAVLARFALERLHGAGGRVFPAPAQAFSVEMGQAFRGTFDAALEAVRTSLGIDPAASQLEDLRVSIELLGRGAPPAAMRIEGASAGAALALGVAKCWADGKQGVAGEALELRNLDLKSVAVTAELMPGGRLERVRSVPLKALETREAQSHEVNALVVAQNQDGFAESGGPDTTPKCFLWPGAGSTAEKIASGEEPRSPESLLVVRAVDLPDAVRTLHELQSNTLLKVLGNPLLIGAYLLGGNRWFTPALIALLAAGWYFLPGWWFLMIGAAWVAAWVVFVRSRIRKIKRRAGLCLLPRRTTYAPRTWANMAETLGAGHPARPSADLCGWFQRLLSQSKAERLTLPSLNWVWWRSRSLGLGLSALALSLALLASPLQHCLAEHLFPGTARVLRGESRRGEGNNVKYAAFGATCGPGWCVSRMTIGSHGLIRLFLEPKARAARSLRITSVDTMSHLKVNDDGPGSQHINVPVVNDEAKFYYGVDENTPWEIELEVEVLCYCGRSLGKVRLIGDRTPPHQ